MSFLSVGVDHTHAPLDVLEQVALADGDDSKLLASLTACANIHEAVVISTCLRTEVVAVIDRFHGAVDDITAALAATTGLGEDALTPHLSIQFDRGVVAHLFEVAAGLHSTVPGEHEILGQLKRSLAKAEEENAVGAELQELFHRALAAGRRARSETGIARGTVSFAHAAVVMAQHEHVDDLAGSAVVVVGAGQLAQGVVRGLVALDQGPAAIRVVNRSVEHARELAAELGDARVTAHASAELAIAVTVSDVVIVAAETEDLGLDEYLLSRAEPLLILDLAMPRLVNPRVDRNAAIRRRDLEALGAVVEKALDGRRDELERAAAVVALEIDHYQEHRRSRGAAAIVAEYRDHLEHLRTVELERRRSEFDDLTPEQFERVESLTRSLLAKVAHQPTVALKEVAGTDRGLRLNEALRLLFDL